GWPAREAGPHRNRWARSGSRGPARAERAPSVASFKGTVRTCAVKRWRMRWRACSHGRSQTMSESERRNDAEKSGVRHRVFYALWPDEETRASLARATRHAVRRCGGRPIRRENLHITLAFLGSVDETGLQRALDL